MKFKNLKILHFFLMLDLILVTIWLLFGKSSPKIITNPQNQYPEISEIASKKLNFDDLKTYFTNLASQKGAKYAYAVLKVAPVPPNTDMHLLGHVVGDLLYKQQGADGIQICTQDFRNACSHSIVVGLFTDKGETALSEIEQACKKAPGGLGAYTMCYHGLGHGILAYEGYNLPKTIELCQKTGTPEHGNKEYPECVSGAVMEIISGGGHDRELWLKERPKYLKKDNPFYICSFGFMPEEARGRCYDYITPYLWEAIGADLGNPTEADFEKSFKLCEKLEENYRYICFGGFGKEFVGLAQARDIRRVDQMDNNKLKKIVDWCNIAADKQGISACLISALSSIYWGGENDYHGSIRFCQVISDSENQKACFLNLIGQASSYMKNPKDRESFCKELPVEITSECKRRLT